MNHRKTFDVSIDYHQFYLFDPGADFVIPADYTKEDVRRRVLTGPYSLVIQPERDGTVPVTAEVHDADPRFDSAVWDHVAEASLHLPTGELVIREWGGANVAEFSLTPGWYRVRSLGGGFGTIDRYGLEGGDHYLLVLWPAPFAEVLVLKQWAED